jgi:hypothetical protein
MQAACVAVFTETNEAPAWHRSDADFTCCYLRRYVKQSPSSALALIRQMQVTKLRGFRTSQKIHSVILLGWYHSC